MTTATDVEKPKRIQRKRTKGSRLPEGTLCVTRPGPFGNCFPVGMWFRKVTPDWFETSKYAALSAIRNGLILYAAQSS